MKCVVYTTKKYKNFPKKVSIKNIEFAIIVSDKKYKTQEDISYNADNVQVKENVLAWSDIPNDKDFSMVIVPAKDYKIRRGLYGISNGTRSQIFANTNNSRTKDTIKHELLHCIAKKFGKTDTLHEMLKSGKSLEDFEEYLWAIPKVNNLLSLAKSKVGEDASPNDMAPDGLGCAESVSTLISHLINFPIILSTKVLYETLKSDSRFERTLKLDAGNIIISPTGYGNGNLAHGHVGIIGENEIIYSNDSATGNWLANYTITSWVNRYRKIGGFPIFVFKMK